MLLCFAFQMQSLILGQRCLPTRIATSMVRHGTCIARKAHLHGDAGMCADAALVQTNLLYVSERERECIWLIRGLKWLVRGLLEAMPRPRTALYDKWRRKSQAQVSSARYHLLATLSKNSVLI